MDQNVSILKSIWVQDKAGRWTIHGIKGLDLKPQQGYSDTYFRFENDLCLLTDTPGPIIQNLFASFGTTEFLLRQSIVPIVSWTEGDSEVRCIGTGFFVSASGLLITAAHVVRDPIDERYAKSTKIDAKTHKFDENLVFGVVIPMNPALKNNPFFALPRELQEAKSVICPFEWTQHWGKEIESPLFGVNPSYQLDIDIAICKVRQHNWVGPYQPLNIGQHRLRVGDRAVAVGYAEMSNIKQGVIGDPELVVSVGSVTAIYEDNISVKHNSTPGPNFEFSALIPGKMSGSPILVGSGVLTKGVVSRSFQNENHATGCLIAAAMDLPLMGGKSLLDLQKSGSEGIAKIHGADL